MNKVGIGKRNIKTAISVFITLLIYILLYFINESIGKENEPFVGLTA